MVFTEDAKSLLIKSKKKLEIDWFFTSSSSETYLNDENVAEVSAEKSGKKKKNKKSDILPVKIFKIFKGSSFDKIRGYGY